jgi:hypothetical protein
MKLAAIHISNGTYVVGESKADIVNQIFTWKFDGRTLVMKAKYYTEERNTTYSDEYTDEEMHNEAVKYMFDRLTSGRYYGWAVFINHANVIQTK